MKLLEYLTPMKNLPNRFSNLAFWRVLRNFKDDVVEAFTYVNTWGSWVESVDISQNEHLDSHDTSISQLQTDTRSLTTRVDTLNSGLTSLRTFVYDGSADFKSVSYSDTHASVLEIGDTLYMVQSTVPYIEFNTVPLHVTARAMISIFTNADKTSNTTISIPVTHVITLISGKTRVTWTQTPFSAPYGVNRLVGVYISYLTHT